jgi:hypothetical protein
MLILPGWAALSLSSLWREWRTLQRWIVAVGLSIAFYPALFYGMRSVLPFLTLGPYKMGALLVASAALIAWRMRRHWREQFALDELEWIAVAVFAMTLFTRFWIIRDYQYPAWSDSLHHALLTRLTAVQGQLPTSMEPYFPIPLGQYHLGLYSLTATTQWLAQVPAHTALLWTAQVLNGLCGLGVYLVLDRKVGRSGAIVGAVTVGLLSHQPAFYVNWGRFTQLSSQTILLIAWLVTWEALKAWGLSWREHRAKILWHAGLAAVLTGAVFLLHFRVAAFYLPLVLMSLTWELWKARGEYQLGRLALGGAVVGVVALLVATPALWEALRVFIHSRSNAASQTLLTTSELTETIQGYHRFPWSSVPHLTAHVWLIVLAAPGAVVGVLRRNKLTIACVIWIAVLYLLASAYALGVPLLDLTNLGAVLIMLYLPIGLVLGCATEELLARCRQNWRERAVGLVIAVVLIAGFVTSHLRVLDIEPRRHFVTPEDMAAMRWIQANTPPDALFAVNTFFWLPSAPHGTDGGYWIPYFTGRKTTAGAMLLSLAEQAYMNEVIDMSRAVERLEVDNKALADLEALGVGYLYAGRRGDFSGLGLDVERLNRAIGTKVLYSEGGVSVLGIGIAD